MDTSPSITFYNILEYKVFGSSLFFPLKIFEL